MSNDKLGKKIDELNNAIKSKLGAQLFIDDYVELQSFMESFVKIYGESKKELERVKEEKNILEKFYASIIHDIRSPLNTTMGYSSMLKGETDNEAIQEGLSLINLASKKIERLTNTIVSYNNVLAGKELNKEEFILKDSLNSIYSLNKINVENKGLEFNLDYEPTDSIMINTDKQLFERIFDNLISNAVKFTSKGHIKMGVHELLDEKGLNFYVEDTGIGISNEYRDKVFDMKTQINKKDSSQGMGYGLSIVKEFVNVLGGEIKINSQPNIGSTFSFLMPCKTYKKI